MNIVKEGDQRQVVCESCGLTGATYRLRDIEFSDGSATVKHVLAGVCDTCDGVVSLPSQSTAQVRAEYNKVKSSVDVRLPAHYLDILHVAAQIINPDLPESFNKPLILYYLHALSSGRYPATDLHLLLNTDLAKAKSSKRLSLKLNQHSLAEINALMQSQGLQSNTDVFKLVILKINEDIVQQKELSRLPELRNLAAAFA